MPGEDADEQGDEDLRVRGSRSTTEGGVASGEASDTVFLDMTKVAAEVEVPGLERVEDMDAEDILRLSPGEVFEDPDPLAAVDELLHEDPA